MEEIAEETGDDDYEIGDTYTRKLSLSSFGRRGILNIRQNLQGRIMDIEKANVFKKYSEKVGDIFTGEVYQTEAYFPTWINREDAAHVRVENVLVVCRQRAFDRRIV